MPFILTDEYIKYFKQGIKQINELPLYFQNVVNTIILKYPDIQIYLFGSYYRGDYHNETSSQEFINFKREYKHKTGRKFKNKSDLDLMLNYKIDLEFDNVDLVIFTCIEEQIINFPGILLYDGSKKE